jgi:peptidoglycan/LPS O-acetylase OafA/YrhL
MRIMRREIARSMRRLPVGQRVRQELLSRSDNRFPALDGVRAIAALLIVFFHSLVAVEQTGGAAVIALPPTAARWLLARLWIGVDIFFVLSGFLIGRMLLVELQQGRIDFRGFYIRRVARIFPAYYLVLTVALIGFFTLSTISRTDLLRAALANYLYISNYVPGHASPNFMGWAWSLCVEEHFYLLFPVLLTALFGCCGRRGRLAVLAAFPLLPLAARAAAFVRQPGTVLWNDMHWQTHTHCDGLLLGVLIAYLFVYHHAPVARVVARLTPAMLAASVVCFAAVFLWGGPLQPGFFAVVLQLFVLAAGVALVITSCLFADNLVSRFLAHPSWYPIARVSYGTYLIHPLVGLRLVSPWPAAPMTLATSGVALLAFAVVVAAVSLLIASAMFLWVELPLLHAGRRLSRRQAAVGDWRILQTAARKGPETKVAPGQT